MWLSVLAAYEESDSCCSCIWTCSAWSLNVCLAIRCPQDITVRTVQKVVWTAYLLTKGLHILSTTGTCCQRSPTSTSMSLLQVTGFALSAALTTLRPRRSASSAGFPGVYLLQSEACNLCGPMAIPVDRASFAYFC